MRKSSKIIIITFAFYSFACNKQRQQEPTKTIGIEIQKIVKEISEDNVFTSNSTNGEPTKQWARYEKLQKVATDDELKLLTNNENGVVRCYAFQALTHRKNNDVFQILLKHLSDTTRIKAIDGCFRQTLPVYKCFINQVTPELTYPANATISEKAKMDSLFRIEYPYILTTDQRKTVDSILNSRH